MGSNLKMIELGVTIARERGRAAKIAFSLYMPMNPNIGRELTPGQPRSSFSSIADHCFISSEMRSILGRLEAFCLDFMSRSRAGEFAILVDATPHQVLNCTNPRFIQALLAENKIQTHAADFNHVTVTQPQRSVDG